MKVRLSPELIVARYIKSATNGRIVSVRLRRIFTLIVFPIWIIGLIGSSVLFYDGCQAWKKYNNLKEAYRKECRNCGLDNHQPEWDFVYEEEYQSSLFNTKQDIYYMNFLPGFILAFFVFPWIVLRLIFWVVDAKEVEPSI